MKTLLLMAASWVVGTALGIILVGADAAHQRRLVRRLRRGEGKEKRPMGVMDKVLVLEAVLLVAYTITAMIAFWHTSTEPSTLTACVFGVCGVENGVMGWIKTSKEKIAEKAEKKAEEEEATPPEDREEPPDVGM